MARRSQVSQSPSQTGTARSRTPKTMSALRQRPPFRPLKVYAFDPTRGRTLGNYMTINTRYEPLTYGPIGQYLAVIDYDAGNKCYYKPVDLDDPAVLMGGGLDPSESDPQFHQQMVYAVASETIRLFEYALGRPIRWSFSRWGKRSAERERLRILPHGMQDANAYYSRELRSLVFGYFPATATDVGTNLPGQTIFTCLSHDIIAHETTHALVDSQRDFFMESTGPDASAFHEAFADIVALFQHFSYEEALRAMIQRTGGRIHHTDVGPEIQSAGTPFIQSELSTTNPMVELAKQFGEAMGMRKALRGALGTPPNPAAITTLSEPHARGSILVAAVFDAFFTIYVRRTSDLMRIARSGGASVEADNVHPDLAARLAEAAATTAQHFLNICIRALDYCPPVDILFGDFLRAVVTADSDLVPDDPHGYRPALIDAFRSRGIVPENVTSFSEEGLRWCPPEITHARGLPRCTGLESDIFKGEDSEGHQRAQHQNAVVLYDFAKKNATALGLSDSLPIQARTFHEVHRVSPDGTLGFDVVAELTQHREVLRDPADAAAGSFVFRGGTTLVITRDGDVKYAIQKSVGRERDDKTNRRLERQREYQAEREDNLTVAPYAASGVRAPQTLDFRQIHRGF